MNPNEEAELQEVVRTILRDSDIVWPKYGIDTVDTLATRITAGIKARGFRIVSEGEWYELIDPIGW